MAEVADDLGVAVVSVQAALRRNGQQSPHRHNGPQRLPRPSPERLERWWATDGTIKGVAQRGEVSPNPAAVWLAEAGIFVRDTPAISRADHEAAIAAGDSIEVIRRRHRVTGRTVIVELYRHRLFTEHRRRPEFGDQFPVADATIAVDTLNVDWNAQAVGSAESYLDFSNFSLQGLIDELSSEFGDQYTIEQAAYGEGQAGIC